MAGPQQTPTRPAAAPDWPLCFNIPLCRRSSSAEGNELGTPFLNVLARAASSPDNSQATTAWIKRSKKKYSASGAYGDVNIFKRPYLTENYAQEYLANATHYSSKAIQYAKDICNYIYDTYGRFPARLDAFHAPGIWLQFSHLELEYYEEFYNKNQFERQAEHAAIWGE
jgi:hypothetical protein